MPAGEAEAAQPSEPVAKAKSPAKPQVCFVSSCVLMIFYLGQAEEPTAAKVEAVNADELLQEVKLHLRKRRNIFVLV